MPESKRVRVLVPSKADRVGIPRRSRFSALIAQSGESGIASIGVAEEIHYEGRGAHLMKFEICIDVEDVDRAVAFYGQGLGLTVAKHERDWAQLKLGEQTVWLMKVESGSDGAISRDYGRHWTPVHLDIQVDDIDKAVERAVAAGGKLEKRPKPDLANLCDPSGNGVDLVQRSDD
jgi:predicted enzyme related to lactoylglutathione lyase